MAEIENVTVGSGAAVPTSPGTAGVQSQAPGQATTVSTVAGATGGIAPGNLVETDIDDQLFRFQSEDTALMSLMLKAKKVKVNSPEVEHFMIDEQRSSLTTDTAVAASSKAQFVLPLAASDQNIPRDYHTLLVPDVDGYAPDGKTVTPGKSLMLFVTGRDTTTDNPVVRAVNGPKTNETDAFCTTPAIPAGSKVKLLANAMYETQKEVDPDLIVPRPSIVYLQKRGMNQVCFRLLRGTEEAHSVHAEPHRRTGNPQFQACRQSHPVDGYQRQAPCQGAQARRTDGLLHRGYPLAVQARTAARRFMDLREAHCPCQDVFHRRRCSQDRPAPCR